MDVFGSEICLSIEPTSKKLRLSVLWFLLDHSSYLSSRFFWESPKKMLIFAYPTLRADPLYYLRLLVTLYTQQMTPLPLTYRRPRHLGMRECR